MYRIQLATGLEAIYRSLEELAVSVQNGIVCPDALVYHRKTGSWLPIENHPHYQAARELVLPESMRPFQVRLDQPANSASPSRPGTPAGPPAPAPTPKMAPTEAPGLPGRQRSGSSWLMAAVVSGLATFGWFLSLPESVEPPPPEIVVAGLEAPKSSAMLPSLETRLSPEISSDASSEATYGDAYQHARTEFEKSIGSLGLGDMFAPSRIGTTADLERARRILGAVRNVVAVYQGKEVRIDQTFGMANSSMRESIGTARSVDSLISATDSIYTLLQATAGYYRLQGGRIAFEDPQATAAYVGQALWLEARLRDWNRNPARTPMTIRPLVAALGRVPRSQTGF